MRLPILSFGIGLCSFVLFSDVSRNSCIFFPCFRESLCTPFFADGGVVGGGLTYILNSKVE